MLNILKKVFGTRNDRELKRLSKIVEKINEFEVQLEPLTDEALAAKTPEFKSRLAGG